MTVSAFIDILKLAAPNSEVKLRTYNEQGDQNGHVSMRAVELREGFEITYTEGPPKIIAPEVVLS